MSKYEKDKIKNKCIRETQNNAIVKKKQQDLF